jgi:D-amino-acid dehydrogenase
MNFSQINNNNKGKKVAVLGAGIIGINCALELQSLGFQVSLIDKTGIGEGCSKRNAGHFATEQVFPLAETSLLWQLPKLLLDPLGPMALSPSYFPKALPWFFKFMTNMLISKRAKNTQALTAINKHAIEYYKPTLRAANAEHLLTSKGSLLVFESQNRKDAEKVFNRYKSAGIAVKLLDRAQTLLLEPNLSHCINYSLYFTGVAHTANPHELCHVLASQALKLGAQFVQAEVSQIISTKSGVKIEYLPSKSMSKTSANKQQEFDQVVVATGAWSKPLLAQLGYKLPIEAERGYSLDLPYSPQSQLTRPVASAERKFIITPMTHGLRLAGTVEFAGLTKMPEMKRANTLYKNAQYLLDDIPTFSEQSAEPEQRWMGFRPSLPDSLPVIGQAPKHSNIFLALGHQHLGLTLGAITSKLIGQVMTGQKTDIDISPFTISRFN